MTGALDDSQSTSLPEIDVLQRQAVIYNKNWKNFLCMCCEQILL